MGAGQVQWQGRCGGRWGGGGMLAAGSLAWQAGHGGVWAWPCQVCVWRKGCQSISAKSGRRGKPSSLRVTGHNVNNITGHHHNNDTIMPPLVLCSARSMPRSDTQNRCALRADDILTYAAMPFAARHYYLYIERALCGVFRYDLPSLYVVECRLFLFLFVII